jgi:hypothetical protein
MMHLPNDYLQQNQCKEQWLLTDKWGEKNYNHWKFDKWHTEFNK